MCGHWAVGSQVATQFFGLFPNVHDSWQLQRASRDRTYSGAEEGGEESDVKAADMVEKAAQRSLNQWEDTFLPVPHQAPVLGSAVHA
jgi:hypothetical protein